MYRTTDGGKTWTRVLATDGATGASDVYFDYQDPQVAYALVGGGVGAAQTAAQTSAPGTGAYKSTDGGTSWKLLAGGAPSGNTNGRISLRTTRRST